MKMNTFNIFCALIIGFFIMACESKPKVIESVPVGSNTLEVFKNIPSTQVPNSGEHKVVVEEALNTEKYTYLNVTENGESFWIAIPKREVEIGATYYYKGGLLKKNFQSREFNRVFETVYLVSEIRKQPINSSGSGSAVEEALANMQSLNVQEPIKVTPAEGAIKISELLANLKKYDGKLVKITGKCVKINPMIMSRNWVHIQDGSADNFDLTVTTTENIPLGAVVSLEGTIALNKDFGAGYKYDIIMEGAVLK